MAQPISLWEALSQIPDPRDASGTRHLLQAVLTLSAVAISSGAKSLYAIAQFGRDRGKEFAKALGFTRERTPCCTSFHYLFERLDRQAFEKALRQWVRGHKESHRWHEISIDGKELRGRQGHHVAGVRVLAAYAHKGTLVSGDAMFCQRDMSWKILKKRTLAVAGEENQPELPAAIVDAFDDEGISPRERKLAQAERQIAV